MKLLRQTSLCTKVEPGRLRQLEKNWSNRLEILAKPVHQACYAAMAVCPPRSQGNFQSEGISSRVRGLQQKLSELESATGRRGERLSNSSEYLQFNWKADLVESWISEPLHAGCCVVY